MKYYQAKCPECGEKINIHKSGKHLFLKNVCIHLRFYKAMEPLPLSSVKEMFNKHFRVAVNNNKTTTVVLTR